MTSEMTSNSNRGQRPGNSLILLLPQAVETGEIILPMAKVWHLYSVWVHGAQLVTLGGFDMGRAEIPLPLGKQKATTLIGVTAKGEFLKPIISFKFLNTKLN